MTRTLLAGASSLRSWLRRLRCGRSRQSSYYHNYESTCASLNTIRYCTLVCQSHIMESLRESTTPLRAYKACTHCRRRKTRCDFGPDDAPPCLRCHRERRECELPRDARAHRKRAIRVSHAGGSGVAPMDGDVPPESEAACGVASCVQPSQPVSSFPAIHQSAHSNGQDHSTILATPFATDTSGQTPNHAFPSDPPLDRSVIDTVVSGDNDALNFLFRATETPITRTYRQQESINDSVMPLEDTLDQRRESSLRADALHPQAYNSARDLWSLNRFVREGWLQSEEAIALVDA
jgi:hypothetical protein